MKSQISIYLLPLLQEHLSLCKYTKYNQEGKFCQNYLQGKKKCIQNFRQVEIDLERKDLNWIYISIKFKKNLSGRKRFNKHVLVSFAGFTTLLLRTYLTVNYLKKAIIPKSLSFLVFRLTCFSLFFMKDSFRSLIQVSKGQGTDKWKNACYTPYKKKRERVFREPNWRFLKGSTLY